MPQKNLCISLRVLAFSTLLVALQSLHAQQATLDGNVVNIPVVVFGDLFYEIQLGLVPNTNPPELVLVDGYQVFNKESEVEYKSGVNGIWTIIESVNADDCGVDPYTDSYDLSVVRNGDQLTVSAGEGEFYGTIDGNTLNWSGSIDEEDGNLVTSASVTFSPDESSISGSSSWTLTFDEEGCSGSSIINGELTVPEEVPYEEFATEDPTMPYVLNAVDESATKFDGLILSIPAITVGDVNFWVDLELVSDNPIQFKLIDSGIADVQMGLLRNANTEEFNGAVFYNKSIGRIQLNFNPISGLLHEALIEGEFYIFTNYTATTVDVIYVELDSPPVILVDIPLTESAIDYVDEITSNLDEGGSIEALSARLSIRDQILMLSTEEESDAKETAADRAGKGLGFVKEVFDEAGESGSFKIPDLTKKIVKDHAKSYGKKVIRENVDTGALNKFDTIAEGLDAAKTIARCLTFTATFDWALACSDYLLNYDETNAKIDNAINLGHDTLDEARQRKIEAYDLRMEESMEKESNGNSQTVLDTDRNNNDIPDELDGPNLLESEFYLRAVRISEVNVHKEDIGNCPPLSYKLALSSMGVKPSDATDWWWGCTTENGRKLGIWTRYWEDPEAGHVAETIEVEIRTYKDGVQHGRRWNRDPLDGGTYSDRNFVDGKLDGPWEDYYQGKFVSLRTFKNGEFHGPYITYRPDGASDSGYEGQYLDGLREGPWKHYYQDKLDVEGQYVNGIPVGDFKIYVNGILDRTDTYDSQGNVIKTTYADEQ